MMNENLEPEPRIRGPKLYPFSLTENLDDIEFLRPLSSDHNPTNVPHSRVFQVIIGGRSYALKVFNFFSLEELRPFIPMREHLLQDNVVRHHLDPFFAECRAFGRLVEKGKDGELAVRCHGYVLLSKKLEQRIVQKFGIRDWNRCAGDGKSPLRAIVKDYVRFITPFGRKPVPKMRAILKELNQLGIYNMDIREDNYRGGRLFDFSTAITTPHMHFRTELRPRDQILKTMAYDLEAFDFMVKKHDNAKKLVCTQQREKLKLRSDEGKEFKIG